MYNPVRRSKNIGTAKQGHGNDNTLTIPQPKDTNKKYWERLVNPKESYIKVYDRKIKVLTEELKKEYYYSVTKKDMEEILNKLPKEDLKGLDLIVFRQPKKKEEILCPVWGRLIYSFEYRGMFYPTLIIESYKKDGVLKFDKKMSLDFQKEFERYKEDGCIFEEKNKYYTAKISPKILKNIQLYRTIPHEIGHLKQYMEFVGEKEQEASDKKEWQKRFIKYLKIPEREKEEYAHKYAGSMVKKIK